MSVKAITNLNLKHLVDELKANFFVNKDEKGVPGGAGEVVYFAEMSGNELAEVYDLLCQIILLAFMKL